MNADLPPLGAINSTIRSILKELILSGKQKRSKSVPTLCEAYSSLKACPIQFTDLQQLLALAGFGEALVDELENLLLDWCKEKSKSYTGSGRKKGSTNLQQPSSEDELVDEETDSDLEDCIPASKPKTKSKATKEPVKRVERKKKQSVAAAVVKEPKLFVPQHRTGTHGILVSLYTLTSVQPEAEGEGEGEEAGETAIGTTYYSKAKVILFAQPYSDAKFNPKVNPTASHGFGTNFHSAWSGVKTLINRGYIYRRGNPASFGLSNQGWHVAQLCAAREKGLEAGCNVDKLGSVPSTSKAAESGKKMTKSATSIKDKAGPSSSTGVSSAAVGVPFLYTYLTDSEQPIHTTQRVQAQIRLSDQDFRMMYRITFAKDLIEHAFAKSCVVDIIEEGNLCSGWVKESVCNEIAPGIGDLEGKMMESVKTKKTPGAKKDVASLESSTDSGESHIRAPLKPVSDQLSLSKDATKAFQGGEKIYSQTCSTIDVIELLTSSDVEMEVPTYPPPSKRRTVQRKLVSSSDSDSDLSDLASSPKATKTKKRKSS